MRGRLFPVDGDWYEWRQEPALSATVLVQVGVAPGGRLVLTGLRIDSEPTAELLRSIPVGRIEAAANAQLTIVDDTIVTMAPSRRRLPSGAPVEDTRGWETTDPDRAVRRPASSPAGTAPPAGAAGGRRGRPDVFYRDVARAYIDLAQTSPRPAAELAETHDVPVTTAHRWIKESRRRGFLPPGRPGKAG